MIKIDADKVGCNIVSITHKYNITVFEIQYGNNSGEGVYLRYENIETGDIEWKWNTLFNKNGIAVSAQNILENEYQNSLRESKIKKILK